MFYDNNSIFTISKYAERARRPGVREALNEEQHAALSAVGHILAKAIATDADGFEAPPVLMNKVRSAIDIIAETAMTEIVENSQQRDSGLIILTKDVNLNDLLPPPSSISGRASADEAKEWIVPNAAPSLTPSESIAKLQSTITAARSVGMTNSLFTPEEVEALSLFTMLSGVSNTNWWNPTSDLATLMESVSEKAITFLVQKAQEFTIPSVSDAPATPVAVPAFMVEVLAEINRDYDQR